MSNVIPKKKKNNPTNIQRRSEAVPLKQRVSIEAGCHALWRLVGSGVSSGLEVL